MTTLTEGPRRRGRRRCERGCELGCNERSSTLEESSTRGCGNDQVMRDGAFKQNVRASTSNMPHIQRVYRRREPESTPLYPCRETALTRNHRVKRCGTHQPTTSLPSPSSNSHVNDFQKLRQLRKHAKGHDGDRTRNLLMYMSLRDDLGDGVVVRRLAIGPRDRWEGAVHPRPRRRRRWCERHSPQTVSRK